MSWKVIEVPEGEEMESDLTDSELVGVSVSLANHANKSANDESVYRRAWRKIQPVAEIANSK